MNITIRKDKNYGYFGQATAGDGVDALPQSQGIPDQNRYIGTINAFRFNGDQQMALLGSINNTNVNTFSFGSPGGGGGGFGGGGSSFGGGRNFERKERGDFGGKPRTGNFQKDGGFKKRDDDRSERPQRREFNNDQPRTERPARREFNTGEGRPERLVRREFNAGEGRPERPVRKEFASAEKKEKQPYVAKQHEKGVSDFIPKKRANKMTDYLDKSEAPAKTTASVAKKEGKKDDFKIEFRDDDLNW